MYRNTLSTLLLVATTMAVVCGCSDSEYPLANVSGIVTLDGQPLEGAKLVFTPKGDSKTPYPGPFHGGDA